VVTYSCVISVIQQLAVISGFAIAVMHWMAVISVHVIAGWIIVMSLGAGARLLVGLEGPGDLRSNGSGCGGGHS
jgi:hypothetical protein